MAAGEKSFSTAEAKKTTRNFDPIPAGIYELKLLGGSTEIRTADPSKNAKTGKMSQPKPRISLRFEALGSGKDGGKNALIFHDLYTDMTPNAGGTVAPTGADQLKGLCDALQEHADIPFVMFLPKGATEKVKILNPQALAAWLKLKNGAVVKANIKVQAGTKDYPEAKNKLTEFIDEGESQSDDDAGEDAIPDDTDAIPDSDDELPPLEEEKKNVGKSKPAPKKKR